MNCNICGPKVKFSFVIVALFTFSLILAIVNIPFVAPAYAACTLPTNVGGGGLDTDCDAISDAWEIEHAPIPRGQGRSQRYFSRNRLYDWA